jgi:hypothetical protein
MLPRLEEVPLYLRRDMWFMHDGAPPHFSWPVRAYLDAVFPNRWIGHVIIFAGPSRSPDFNPLDFSIWSRMKDIVYKESIGSCEELWQRIQIAANEVRRNPNMLFQTRRSLRKRVKCISVNGGFFEQLL